jgi:hypothetical protein
MTRAMFVRARLSVALLMERRVGLFATLDGLFLFGGVMMAFTGNGYASAYYLALFLFPLLFLGVPMMADCVAVERRSGTLDLALSSPGADWYFERRMASAASLIVAQGWIAILVARTASEEFAWGWALAQMVVVTAFLATAVLNWSVRLKTAGGVAFATYATIGGFAPWFFSNPVRPPNEFGRPMDAGDILTWSKNNLVLLGAAVIFYLYAMERLNRPEEIIT